MPDGTMEDRASLQCRRRPNAASPSDNDAVQTTVSINHAKPGSSAAIAVGDVVLMSIRGACRMKIYRLPWMAFPAPSKPADRAFVTKVLDDAGNVAHVATPCRACKNRNSMTCVGMIPCLSAWPTVSW